MSQKFFIKKKLLSFYYFLLDALFYTNAQETVSFTPRLNGGNTVISEDIIFTANNIPNQEMETCSSQVNTSYNNPANNCSFWREYNKANTENVNKIKEKSSQYGTDILQKNSVVGDNLTTNETSPKTLNTKGIGAGHYLMANVLANPKNTSRFVEPPNSYGLSASYFINPENSWRHICLKGLKTWNSVLISYLFQTERFVS